MIKVSICIITYNQEDYISEAIESILSQETGHAYEIIIGEDCSTDNTGHICLDYQKKYPDTIKVINQDSNLGLIGNFVSTIQAACGEYIALCDGDDYWIDPLKLDKQIQHFDSHMECGLVHTNKKILQDGIVYENEATASSANYEELLLNSYISVPTVMFRKTLAENYLTDIVQLSSDRGWKMQDYPLWLHIGMNNKICYIDEYTAMYRMLPNSACRLDDGRRAYLFDRSILDIRLYYFKQYWNSHHVETEYRHRFHEMIFHSRKRLLLNYGWIARKELLRLFWINPFSLCYIMISKIKRIRSS